MQATPALQGGSRSDRSATAGSFDSCSRLFGRIYEAVPDSRLWPDRFAEIWKATSCAAGAVPRAGISLILPPPA